MNDTTAKPLKAPRWARDLEATLRAIEHKRDRLLSAIDNLRTERDALLRTKHYDHRAKIHYKDGRYAVLHVPNPDAPTGRDRLYIGVDADEIKNAEDAIKRGARLRAVEAELDALERDAARWAQALGFDAHSVHIPGESSPRRSPAPPAAAVARHW